MKTKPIPSNRRLTIYTICMNLMIFASIQLCKGSSNEDGNMRTLSRRRRYLIFPEGSSLQIVYDTYHPVVGHTNLLTVGLTGALAWALPSKLAYPDDYFNEMYKHENMSLLRRNGNDVEVNSIRNENVNAKPPTHNYYDNFNPHLSNVESMNEMNTTSNFYNGLMNGKIPSRKIIFPWHQPRHSHHSIHPTFQKRSTWMNTIATTAEQIFHSKFHRASRYVLYEHLEKFIDSAGYNGNDCILKALCETGQIERNEKHRSFLGEMMRAIFSLPHLDVRQKNLSDDLYAAAYNVKSNCAVKYAKCSQYLWKSTFH